MARAPAARGAGADGGAAAARKSAWPELVGAAGDAAVAAIRAERPDLVDVEAVGADAMVTMDYREDRVRVFVADDGTVSKAPSVG